MHQSSCAASAADGATTVLSSLRNLNAVIASDVESGEVAWVLASDPSLNTSYKTYAFAHEQEKFYYPHMVSQLPDGHVLLVDDGNNRPGCARGSEGSCYSRAVEYALVDGRVRVDAPTRKLGIIPWSAVSEARVALTCAVALQCALARAELSSAVAWRTANANGTGGIEFRAPDHPAAGVVLRTSAATGAEDDGAVAAAGSAPVPRTASRRCPTTASRCASSRDISSAVAIPRALACVGDGMAPNSANLSNTSFGLV